MKRNLLLLTLFSFIIFSESCKEPETDTQSPEVSMSKPVSGDTIRTGDGLLYVVDGSDNTLISQLKLNIKAAQSHTFPSTWGVRFRDTVVIDLVNQQFLNAYSKTLLGLARFATGKYDLTLSAIDVDGNFRQLNPVNLFFQNSSDLIYPTIVYNSVPTSVSVGNPIDIDITLNDNRRLLFGRCELKNGNALVQAVPSFTVSGNSKNITHSFSTSGLAAGEYTLRTEVADSVHNVVVDLKSIVIAP